MRFNGGGRVTNFIKFIRVPSGHVSNEDIRLGSLMIDSLSTVKVSRGVRIPVHRRQALGNDRWSSWVPP
jgi:hypothetical protein